MALKPWERYGGGAPAGDPIIAPADPYKQADEVRANEDQQIERARLGISQAALGISQSNQQRQETLLPLEQQAKQLQVERLQQQVRAGDPVQQQAQNASSLLKAAGVDIERGIDPVSDLIRGSTSGRLQAVGANAWGAITGDATEGMENIGRLKTVASELTLQMTGGSLGAQVSNADRDFIVERVGNIADPTVPADQRLAAWEQVKARMASLSGQSPVSAVSEPSASASVALSPEQEEKVVGFWNNTGGTVTPEAARAWYVQNGIPAPNDEDLQAAIASARQGTSFVPPPEGGPGGGSAWNEIGKGFGSIVEGAAALPGMIINPIGQAMYDVLGYDQQYNAGDIVRGGLGLPNNEGMGDAVIQGATGALTGGLAARAASSITAPGAIRNALELVGRTPLRDTAAGAGAGAGAVLGEQAGGPVGGVVGALAGGVGGYGAANALSGFAAPRAMSALGQAAQRQRVDLLPADAGGAAVRGVTGAARQSPLSAGPVARAGERQQGQMRAATRRIAEDEGNVADTQRAGEGVRAAAERYTTQTSERGRRLYERAGERARGVRIKPLQTISNLDAQITRVRENPAAPPGMVDELVRFRENISNGVGVTGLRDARTTLSQGTYDGQLRSGPEKAMWKGILNDLSSDIDGGLRQAGRNDAARMFRQADEFWKGRVEHIDEVLQPILGKDRSGEDIVATVERMSRGQGGGNARLSRLLSAMTPEEAGNTRAVVIDRLGRANPGAQNAEGTAYSAATFLTNWNKMTPQAKASLFDSPALRRDLNDIAQIAEGTKVGQSAANHSNTAGAIYGNIGAGAAIAYANPAAALIAAGGQYLTGRLMASPAFARLLAKTAKMPDRQAQRTFAQDLGVLAGRETIIASDIRSVMQYLGTAAAQSPGRLAANEQERD